MPEYTQKKEKNGDSGYWVIAWLLVFFMPPVGILMIVLKLASGKRPARQNNVHPYYAQQQGAAPVGARTASVRAGGQPVAAPPSKKKRKDDPLTALAGKGQSMSLLGGILTGVFGFATVMSLVSQPWFIASPRLMLEQILPLLCFTAIGVGLLCGGVRRKKQVRRYRRYLAMIGQRQCVSISALSSAWGCSPAKVRDDLSDLLDAGIFPAGYLDYGGDMLILSGDGLHPPRAEAPVQPAAQETQDAILIEIREVNGGIDNPTLSAQIDRIGQITAKILDYQRENPVKSAQLHSFLSYYLPTTLKILRAYGQLEQQEVAGDNITTAMQRIEHMMEKVVEGFEKQLDQLFQGTAMDITTDVEVLERMLAKDGLSNTPGLQMGF